MFGEVEVECAGVSGGCSCVRGGVFVFRGRECAGGEKRSMVMDELGGTIQYDTSLTEAVIRLVEFMVGFGLWEWWCVGVLDVLEGVSGVLVVWAVVGVYWTGLGGYVALLPASWVPRELEGW